ncbi:MAG: arsenosugar biosynthesis radical SAM protein ArsS [Acidobacteria bacterium]|nr:arsenosugar biosynthesis radical SAM protein ArsS [Acidobacteriota bacterium]
MSKALPVVPEKTNAPPRAVIDFDEKLAAHGMELRASTVDTLQVNVGKLCNQACKHCHVDASPARTEVMTRETAERVISVLRRFGIPTLDITGGAPELNPSFRHLVRETRALGTHVMVRHNLTVMFEPGQDDLLKFFRANDVEVISSLPYFLEQQTDAQRGHGVFQKSIEALRRLNGVGYGIEGNNLRLNLVYNPAGAFLPPPQASIEQDFRRELQKRYGITFNHLYTITNMPIKRFLDYLRRSGNEDRYMRKLVEAFNPATVEGLMCRTLVSVDWTGRLYDCDFNQMLELPFAPELPRSLAEYDPAKLSARRITTGAHCFGCTAGTGSSCGGAVVVSG